VATIDMGRKKRGAAVPLLRRAGTLSNTVWTGLRSTSVPSGVFIQHLSPSSCLATTDIGRKLGGLCPFMGGGAGSPSNTYSISTKCHLDPCSRLATIHVGRKLGARPLFGEGWVPIKPSNTVAWTEAYLHANFWGGGWVPIEHKVP